MRYSKISKIKVRHSKIFIQLLQFDLKKKKEKKWSKNTALLKELCDENGISFVSLDQM